MWILLHVHEATGVEQRLLALILWVLPGTHSSENGKSLPLQSLKVSSENAGTKRADSEHSEADIQYGFHRHNFYFLECHISLMYASTTSKLSSGALDILH